MAGVCKICGGLVSASNEVLGYGGPMCNGLHGTAAGNDLPKYDPKADIEATLRRKGMTKPNTPDQDGQLAHAEEPTAQGHEADNPYSYANITGSTGITVNVFKADTELDKSLRLLRAATDRVDEAVNDMLATNFKPPVQPSDAPSTTHKPAREA